MIGTPNTPTAFKQKYNKTVELLKAADEQFDSGSKVFRFFTMEDFESLNRTQKRATVRGTRRRGRGYTR